MSVTPADLGVYLEIILTTAQTERASMLINDAIEQAEAIVAPLPDGADGVIRAAVARIFLNPAGATTEAIGPFAIGRSANTGSMFSKSEQATLRRLGGGGGAFSIDMLPADSSPQIAPWDAGNVDPATFGMS